MNFNPGIYVLRPSSNTGGGDILSITGGAVVTGANVMFYNTGSTYNPVNGSPDQGDLARDSYDRPDSNEVAGTGFQGIRIAGSTVTLVGLVAPSGGSYSTRFDKMLFYQRRFNDQPISISQGESSPTGLTGRLYTKWGNLALSGGGTFNFALVVGSLSIGGHAELTTQDRIPLQPALSKVRLVE